LSTSEFPFTVSCWQEHAFGQDKQDIRDSHEFVQVYQSILMDCEKQQSIIIEYRNDSNGYYGGYLRNITAELILNKDANILSITLKDQLLSRKLIDIKDVSKGYNCG